ncbi:hypothetical protein TERTU_4466 [Teredinibacter turnerae T7901]|uniref:Uncharacterized protein n=1 Tax=Teredinibacter turnerae (strain ATCC 39867 / T7901) TaxID=377629 RepID=C5BJ58_TERTT|nr:hypothetical protein [Teredinibacter turnerae]ACR13613.1 hypothetical protein TERTU_4466 [Teredinibacter turnerae T7901]
MKKADFTYHLHLIKTEALTQGVFLDYDDGVLELKTFYLLRREMIFELAVLLIPPVILWYETGFSTLFQILSLMWLVGRFNGLKYAFYVRSGLLIDTADNNIKVLGRKPNLVKYLYNFSDIQHFRVKRRSYAESAWRDVVFLQVKDGSIVEIVEIPNTEVARNLSRFLNKLVHIKNP